MVPFIICNLVSVCVSESSLLYTTGNSDCVVCISFITEYLVPSTVLLSLLLSNHLVREFNGRKAMGGGGANECDALDVKCEMPSF